MADQLREHWMNYSKWQQQFEQESEQIAQDYAEMTEATKASLASRGYTPESDIWKREMENLDLRREAEAAEVMQASRDIQTGPTRDILEGRHFSGGYTQYREGYWEDAYRAVGGGQRGGLDLSGGDEYYTAKEGDVRSFLEKAAGAEAFIKRSHRTDYGDDGPPTVYRVLMNETHRTYHDLSERQYREAQRLRAEGGPKSFEDYFADKYGVYAPSATEQTEMQAAEQEKASGKIARQAAGGRTYRSTATGGGQKPQIEDIIAEPETKKPEEESPWWG